MLMSKYIEPMSFLQRVGNHLLDLVSNTWVWVLMYKLDQIRSRQLGYQLPSTEEIMEMRFSVFLSNSHPVTHGSWPYLPNVIEVGGLGVKEAKPLTGDLAGWLDSAKSGAVFISFGSAISPSQMPAEKLDMVLEVFRALPQLSFVWKWDSQIEELPHNVMIKTWIPQQDLLGHPNLRVFVTHGGMGGVSEALYHKTGQHITALFIIMTPVINTLHCSTVVKLEGSLSTSLLSGDNTVDLFFFFYAHFITFRLNLHQGPSCNACHFNFCLYLALVGIPFVNDQKSNLLRAERHGYARLLGRFL